ncbi:MAG: NDP-sugar synthase [Candidatus Berkelbacteria bacterium]|nr:NDP-sugar synthase [Candidatus Berkelbacteria bacterium]
MDRIPFTVTMRKDLLKRVDSLVDGTQIRNRSHALESIVSSHFRPKIKKALILAGGEGIKIKPFTYELPKTMLPVKGRPIFEYILDLLQKQEVKEIYVAIGHLGGKIKGQFGDGAKYSVDITYLEEKGSLGTGGALKAALPKMGDDPFLMIWGDELIDIDLGDMIDFHMTQKPVMTIALTSVSDPTGYGAVKLRRDMVVEHIEKPAKTKDVSHLVSAGVHVVDPRIASFLPRKKTFMLESDIMSQLTKKGQIRGYLFEGQWFDVGTPEIYQRAIREWRG